MTNKYSMKFCNKKVRTYMSESRQRSKSSEMMGIRLLAKEYHIVNLIKSKRERKKRNKKNVKNLRKKAKRSQNKNKSE